MLTIESVHLEPLRQRLAPVVTDDVRDRLDDVALVQAVLGAIAASLGVTISDDGHSEDHVADVLRRSAAVDGLRVLTPQSMHWPAHLLQGVDDAPPALWFRGDPMHLQHLDRAVAVVGARAASAEGVSLAEDVAKALVSTGRPVISGGAFGIDIAGLRSALTWDGVPVAVLAHDLSRAYPAAHAGTFAEIAHHGLLVSEYPVHTMPTRARFLARNRLTVALSQATVVVEAAAQSGSIATANRAALLGRPALAVPGSSGADLLIADGRATPVHTVDEVLANLEERAS